MSSTHRTRAFIAAAGGIALIAPLLAVPAGAAPPDGTWDLAPQAVAQAQSYQDDQDGSFPPAQAIDGDPETRWSSENGPDEDVPYEQWFALDLGAEATVSGLTLEWEAHAVSFSVEVSTAADPAEADWQEVWSTTSGDGGTQEISFDATDARWVRLDMSERTSFDWDPTRLHWYGYSLFEVSVWGTTTLPVLDFAAPSSRVDAGEDAVVPLRLSTPADEPVTVEVASTDDSAVAGTDYDAVDETVTIPAGETSTELTIPTQDHGALAGERSFTLALSEASGNVTLGANTTHTVTLRPHGDLPADGRRIAVDDFEDGLGAVFAWGDGPDSTPTLTTIESTRAAGTHALQAAAEDMTSWSGFTHDFSEAADWRAAGAFSFWFLGTGSGNDLRYELKSGGTNAEAATKFEEVVTDDEVGWREIVVQFSDLREKENPDSDARFDPSNVWGYAVTLSDLGAGTWVFDDVSIVERTHLLMDAEGDVPLTTDADPVGIFAWGGDEASKPTIEVIAEEHPGSGGAAAGDNHVLGGTYHVSSYGGISHNLAAAQDWSSFAGLRFWWRASQETRPASPTAGDMITVEIKDGGPDGEHGELWQASFRDTWSPDGSRWTLIELPFAGFELRGDYQPGTGDTLDGELTLDEAWGYALTMPPGTDAPVEYRLDDVALYGSAEASSGITITPTPDVVLVDGGEDATVTVAATTRDGEPLPQDVHVDWALAAGSAEEGADFDAGDGTLTFDAGADSPATAEITVPTKARDGESTARTIELTLTSDDAKVSGNVVITLNAQELAYLDPDLPVDERVADLMSRMTLEEKVGQMTQAERLGLSTTRDVATYFLGSVLSGGGSVPADNTPAGWADMVDAHQRAALSTRLQIPMIYGVDAVHGHSNMIGATIFPHNIGIGATRDPALIEAQGKVTAAEVRASGIPWTFAPTLAVTGDERWGRSYESFGEDPALVSRLAGAAVRGLQGEDPASFDTATEVLATAKHWLGDGHTSYDAEAPGYPIDQGISHYEDETDLWNSDVVAYLPALEAGVGSIMPSYSAVALGDADPVRMHENTELNTGLLKGDLGFDGFLISDWEGIDKLPGGSYAEKAVRSVDSGLDMAMAPYNYAAFIDAMLDAVESGDVSMERIDDATRRILTQKFRLGLFEHPFADRENTGDVGSAAHRDVARTIAAASQVLLRNDGVLPLERSANLYVAGSTADDLGRQMGGWTISWQGGSGATTDGTTIGDAIAAASDGEVVISPDASAPMDGSDVAVVVVGEHPYAEGEGDVGNGGHLELRPGDLDVIERTCSAMECVVLIVSGRPQILPETVTDAAAVVASWLPGSEGEGVADVLFGDVPFGGRLPVTWPASVDQVPIDVGDADYSPAFAFGWGLRTDDPRSRLADLLEDLPAGSVQEAATAALEASFWDSADVTSAHDVLSALQRTAAQLREARDHRTADAVVSVARDIVQQAISGQGPAPDFTAQIAPEQAQLTSDAEHALLTGEGGTAVRLLAAAIGIDLPAGDDVITPTAPAEPTGPGDDDTPGGQGPTDDPDGPGDTGSMPETGAPVTLVAILAVLTLMLGAGAVLAARRRRGY